MKKLVIYMIVSDESLRTKVGVSSNPTTRLATMQTGSPERLNLVWTSPYMDAALARSVEADVHTGLEPWRVHGEWYDRGCHHCHDFIDDALAARCAR